VETAARRDGDGRLATGVAIRRQRRRLGSDSGRADTAGRGGGGVREAAVGGAGERLGRGGEREARSGEATVGRDAVGARRCPDSALNRAIGVARSSAISELKFTLKEISSN
jgi:hypothetical protein